MSFHLKVDFLGHVQKINDHMLSQIPGNMLFQTPVSEDNFIGFFSPLLFLMSPFLLSQSWISDLTASFDTFLKSLCFVKAKLGLCYLCSEPWALTKNGLRFRKSLSSPHSFFFDLFLPLLLPPFLFLLNSMVFYFVVCLLTSAF